MENKNFYLFTGGPGSGKSTVLDVLRSKGCLTVQEVARDIIRHQVETQGDAVPWGNTVRYSNLMLLRSIVDFEEFAHVGKPCFFDRGIMDVLGYARLIGIPETLEMQEAARKYRYNERIFFFPFWEEIYANDAERKQDMAEAKKTDAALRSVYEDFGYCILEVPFLSPQERAEWILQRV